MTITFARRNSEEIPMSHYVKVIRTNSDIDTGYGPFDSYGAADDFAMGLARAVLSDGNWPNWLDDYVVSTSEPADGCTSPGTQNAASVNLQADPATQTTT